MKEQIVDVYYFDSLQGGSGSTRMPMAEVLTWLKLHSGHLIYRLIDVT